MAQWFAGEVAMKIAVIQFPGSNAESETIDAIERVGMQAVPVLWNESLRKLAKYDGFVIPGGSSYGDMGRAGLIASFDPVMDFISAQAKEGKPVLGIGNGAQILVEAGLIPGMALTYNKRIEYDKVMSTGFYNGWVHMRAQAKVAANAFTLGISPKEILRVPVVHAQGCFQVPADLLEKLIANGMVVFQYCDEAGEVSMDFPINPNGSVYNIAAVMNYAGNVMAIMPHIERAPQGDAIFASMRDFLVEEEPVREGSFVYNPPPVVVSHYQADGAKTLIVDAQQEEHTYLPMERILQDILGIEVSVKRYIHWSCYCGDDVLDKIVASKELVDLETEKLVHLQELALTDTLTFVVSQREGLVGQQKFQILANHFEIDGIKSIKRAVVWQITGVGIAGMRQQVIDSGLLFNPVSQTCVEVSKA